MAKYAVWSGGANTGGAIAGSVPTATEWSNAYTSLTSLNTAVPALAAGDTVFFASDHNAVIAASLTVTLPRTTPALPVSFISLNRTTGAIQAGATEAPTATGLSVTIGGILCMIGVSISASSNANLFFANSSNASYQVIDGCTLGGTAVFTGAGYLSQSGYAEIKNSTIALVVGYYYPGAGKNRLVNVVFLANKGIYVQQDAICEFEGCDFSALTSAALIYSAGGAGAVYKFNSCKLGAGPILSAPPTMGGFSVELMGCSSADHNYNYYYQDFKGVIQADTGHYLTVSPAQIKDVGGTLVPYSLSMAGASAQVSRAFPLYTPWSAVFNALTGNHTVSVQVAYDSAATLLDADLWMEVEYLADTTSPKSVTDNTAPQFSAYSRDILAAGTALTDPLTAWTGTFTNKKTATLSKTVTIQNQGYLRVRVGTAQAATVYVDPTITVA